MASILGHTKYYEPAPRFRHGAAPIDDRLYLWGGRTEDFSESSKRKLASVVEMYDPYVEMWEQRAMTGVPPPGLYAGGCTSLDETLLWYGGTDGEPYFGTLHQLNTVTLNWDELHHNSPSQGPMAKVGCGLVSFEGNKLGLFGGYGIPTGPTQPGSTFTRDTKFSNGQGWTNEFHLFHLQEGVWSSPPTTGSRPPPCSAFSFTAIDSHRAVLFGGRSPKHGRMNDAYIFNVQTMHWSKLDTPAGDPWPVGRSGHAACCLNYGQEHPQLLVSGGRDKDNNTLKDLWVLDVEAGTWKELMLPEDTQPRHTHTVTPFNLSPGVVEATVFGGSPKWIPGGDDQQQPKIAETTVVRLESIEISASGSELPTREWVVMGVAKGRQLGSLERIREKKQEKTTSLVSSELAGERENVRNSESKITELEEKVESAETRVRVALARAVGAEIQCDRIPDLEQQLRSMQHLHHAQKDEFKALTTQYKTTCDHNREQFTTQQQALSLLQYTAQQKEEQLQEKVHESAALQSQNQALANQVVALQRTVAQLEHKMHAIQADSQPVTASISTQTDSTSISTVQSTQLGLQSGVISPRYPAELPAQHAETQQKVTGELLLPENEGIQELQQELKIRSTENQKQTEQLTTLQVEYKKSREQVEVLETEKQKLQEELTKETFLETALGYEVDVLREDLMDREDKLYCLRTQQVEQHTTSSEAAVVDTHSPTTSPALGFLRGAEVVAQRDFVITNKAQTYCWEEYGFRLHVPDGSLEAGLSETTVNVRVTLSGHFQLPANSELVSAVYWVFSPHKFSQPLTVDIEHCAAPSQCSNLSFVRTKCTQKKLPYQFKELEGGVFSQKSTYGSISVNHFSGLGIIDAVKHWWFRKSDQDNSLIYCAQLYAQDGMKEQCVHFVVTRNLESCLTEVKKGFADSGCKKSCSFLFEFDDQRKPSLRLDVPHDGTTFESGWRLFPLYEPMIKKNHVDHFSCGQQLPECELAVQWLKDSPPASFKHKIGLQGAREHTFFTLFLKQTDVSSGSKSENLTQHTFNISSESESDSPYSPDSVKSGETMLLIPNVLATKYTGIQSAPELPDLMNEVAAKIPGKWHEVGIQLGLEQQQLKFLLVSSPTGSQLFASVFTAWKNCMSKDYTWATLIQALKTPAVSELRLARALTAQLTH